MSHAKFAENMLSKTHLIGGMKKESSALLKFKLAIFLGKDMHLLGVVWLAIGMLLENIHPFMKWNTSECACSYKPQWIWEISCTGTHLGLYFMILCIDSVMLL